MFSSKQLRYDISFVEATLTWLKSLQNCRHIVRNGLKIKVHHDRKKKKKTEGCLAKRDRDGL